MEIEIIPGSDISQEDAVYGQVLDDSWDSHSSDSDSWHPASSDLSDSDTSETIDFVSHPAADKHARQPAADGHTCQPGMQDSEAGIKDNERASSDKYLSDSDTSEIIDFVTSDPADKHTRQPAADGHTCQPGMQDSEAGIEDNERATCACDVNVVTRDTGKKWDKKHACKFCGKLVTKISMHLQRVHKGEPEVIKVMMMKKGSVERRQAWGILLNEGDYAHNFSVLNARSGQIIPKYRSKEGKKKKANQYVACVFCKALYCKSFVALHSKNCPQMPGTNIAKRGQSAALGRLLLPVPIDVPSAFYHNCLAKMKDDAITRTVLHDALILKYGKRLYMKRDVEEHFSVHISGRLRELGRLVKCLRERSKMHVSTLTAAIDSVNFDQLVSCIRELAEYDPSTHMFKKGSLALKLGYSLKKCCQIKETEAIKNKDDEAKKQAESFSTVFTGDWYDHVSAGAAQSVDRARMNKPKIVPSCSEIEKVNKLLQQKNKSSDYVTRAKATLCSVSMFNRKRGGEIQRMKCHDFENGLKAGATSDPEMMKNLTPVEKKLINYFKRIEIRGKFNRRVPILLTPEMVENIGEVLQMREQQTTIQSVYIFVPPGGTRPYRGSDVIRSFAVEAGVSDTSLFTFTNLRKHVATLSQALEITKMDQEQLADFLGHDIRVHRSIYRQPVDVLQKAKVAKILFAVNRGMGVTLDQIEALDENEEIASDVQVEEQV